MAKNNKKEAPAKEKEEETPKDVHKDAPPPPKSTPLNWQLMILSFAFIACALAFLPTTLILFFGLMPTFGALVIDPTPDRIKTLTVGCLNVAGCVPFLLELWTGGEAHSIGAAFTIIARAQTLITIYGAAAGGYMIFYTVTGMVAAIMLQSGRSRLEDIKKRMVELERKWGREVTGALPLDERGFAEDLPDDI